MRLRDYIDKNLKDPKYRKAVYEGQWDEHFKAGLALDGARISKGWTLEKLAEKMGTSKSAVSAAVGGSQCSLTFLNKAAKAMGMRIKIELVPQIPLKDIKPGSDINI